MAGVGTECGNQLAALALGFTAWLKRCTSPNSSLVAVWLCHLWLLFWSGNSGGAAADLADGFTDASCRRLGSEGLKFETAEWVACTRR